MLNSLFCFGLLRSIHRRYCLRFAPLALALLLTNLAPAQHLINRTVSCAPDGGYTFSFQVVNNQIYELCSIVFLEFISPAGIQPDTTYLFPDPDPCLPSGATSQLFTLHLSDIPAGSTQFCFLVKRDQGHGFVEVLSEGCVMLPDCGPCASLAHEPIVCIDGFLQYGLSITNESATLILNQVEIIPDDPSLGISTGNPPFVYTNPLLYNLGLQPGQTATDEFFLRAPNALPGQYFTYTLRLSFSDGSTCELRCENPNLTVESALDAYEFPDCPPPCDRTVVTASPVEENGQICCWRFSLDNQLSEAIITSLRFSSNNGLPVLAQLDAPASWLLSPASPATAYTLQPRPAGPIPNQNLGSVITICPLTAGNSPLEILVEWDIRTPDNGQIILESCTQLFNLPINCADECASYTDPSQWTVVGAPQVNLSAGQITFNQLPGNGPPHRVYRSVPLLDDTWRAEFDFSVSAIGTKGGALIPYAFTAGNNEPTGFPLQTNQDVMGVLCWTPYLAQSPIYLSPYLKDGTLAVIPSDCRFQLQEDQTYRIRLERQSATRGELSVFLPDGSLLGSCCFDIPESLTGLNHLQTANYQLADSGRRISGLLENICPIEEPFGNCLPTPCITLIQDSVFCEGGVFKMRVRIQNHSNQTINSLALQSYLGSNIVITPGLVNVSIPPNSTVTLTPDFVLTGSGAIAGREVCYDVLAYSGLNAQGLITCTHNVIDNCKLLPECTSPPASCEVDATAEPFDQACFQGCCFHINVQNGAPAGSFSAIEFSSADQSLINFSNGAPGWNLETNFGFPGPIWVLASPEDGSAVPTGTLNNLFDVCVADGVTQKLYIRWLDAAGNQVCLDSIELVCPQACNPVDLSQGWTSSAANNGQISLQNNQIVFNATENLFDDIRIYRAVSPALGNSWTAEFDVNVSAAGINGSSFVPFVATAGMLEPGAYSSGIVQAAIGVRLSHIPGAFGGRLRVEPFYKPDNHNSQVEMVIWAGCNWYIDFNTDYRFRLERVSATEIKLSITDAQGTPLAGDCCFPISYPVGDLNFVQAANLVIQQVGMETNASVDDITICNPGTGCTCDQTAPSPCTALVMPQLTCVEGSLQYCFTVQNTGVALLNQLVYVSASTPGLSFSPNPVPISVAPGTSATYCVSLQGNNLPLPGSSWCVAMGFDPMSPCLETCVSVPDCGGPDVACDSLAATLLGLTIEDPDTCWYGLELHNNNPSGLVQSVIVSCTPPVVPNYDASLWSITPANGGSLFTANYLGAGGIPTGQNLLFNFGVPQGQNQTISLQWIDSSGQVACTDTLSAICPPNNPQGCVDVIQAELRCEDGLLSYCFTAQNNTGQPLSQIFLFEPLLAGSVASPIQLVINLQPGEQQTYCLSLGGTLPTPASQWCIRHLRRNADDTVTPCFETCLSVPDCGGGGPDVACDSLAATLLGLTIEDPDTCWYGLELHNNNPAGLVQSVILSCTPPVVPNYDASLWNITPANGGSLFTANYLGAGGIPTGQNLLFNFGVPQGQNQTISLQWIDSSGQVACTDTLSAICPPNNPQGCVDVIQAELRCEDGLLSYCFTAQNNTGQPLSQIFLFEPLLAGSVVSPIQLVINLQPGEQQTYCLSLGGTLPTPASQWCIRHLRRNPDDTVTSCFEACLSVPDCGGSGDPHSGCIQLIGDQLLCEDGQVVFGFWLKNETNHPIRSIIIVPDDASLSTGMAEIVLPAPGILPQQTSNYIRIVLGGSPAPGSAFCYTLEAHELPLADGPQFTHRDTIREGCRLFPTCENALCLSVIADSIYCQQDDGLVYTFTLNNPANSGNSIASVYFQFPEQGTQSGFMIRPIALTPALEPGQSRNITTQVYRWGHFEPGDQLCFRLAAFNTLHPSQSDAWLDDCDEQCVSLPACACQQTCYTCCTQSDLALPTGLSPNDDGVNDTYVIHTNGKVCPKEIYIYNRWGNLVWAEPNEYLDNWGGTNQTGLGLPEGTYFVLVRIKATGETWTTFVDLKR